MNHVTFSLELLHWTTLTFEVGPRTVGDNYRIRRTTGDILLLRGGLRHDLGFLVSHFWLLSESLDSLFVLFFTFSASSTRRAELAKSINQDYALLSEDSESPTSSLVSLAPSAD